VQVMAGAGRYGADPPTAVCGESDARNSVGPSAKGGERDRLSAVIANTGYPQCAVLVDAPWIAAQRGSAAARLGSFRPLEPVRGASVAIRRDAD
jgi:hypothetical protein